MRFLLHCSAGPAQVITARAAIEGLSFASERLDLLLETPVATMPLWRDLGTLAPYPGELVLTPFATRDDGRTPINLAARTYDDIFSMYGFSHEAVVHGFNRQLRLHGVDSRFQLDVPALVPAVTFRGRSGPGCAVPAKSVLADFALNADGEKTLRLLTERYPNITFFTPVPIVAPNSVAIGEDLIAISAIGDRVALLVVSNAAIAAATNTEINRFTPRMIFGDARAVRFDPRGATEHLTNFERLLEVLDGIDGRTEEAPANMMATHVMPRAYTTTRTRVLFVSHRAKQCGVAEYGRNVARALGKSKRYDVVYEECESEAELRSLVATHAPAAIVYNKNSLTMPWLNATVTRALSGVQIGIMHEVTQASADAAATDTFDVWLAQDPTLESYNPRVFPTQRLLPVYTGSIAAPARTTIGSFGFGVPGKGFERLVARVCAEFDEADIRLHLPFNDFVDRDGAVARAIADLARAQCTKPGIRLTIDHDFFSNDELLDFLAGNTLNAFFYDPVQLPGNGISSVIDYALAVRRPIAVTSSGMFRQILGVRPTVSAEQASLLEIISHGFAPLEPLFVRWSEANFIADYERIFDAIFAPQATPAAICSAEPVSIPARAKEQRFDRAPSRPLVSSAWVGHAGLAAAPIPLNVGVPGVTTFNRILDDTARRMYEPVVRHLFTLVPEMMARKIPEANVQQGFMYDTVVKLAAMFENPRVLCVGSFEDTAAEGLMRSGMKMTAIDPEVNYDLEQFMALSMTELESFDIIFSTSVLEHVADDETFVRRIGELLAPGGAAVLTVDYHDAYRPGDNIPPVDHRWYTQVDLHDRLWSQLRNCRLLGAPSWECDRPDFYMAGWNYTFASFTFEKLATQFARVR